MRDRILQFLRTLLLSFPSGLLVGAILGAAVALITEGLGPFFAGVILGVILEQLVLGGKRFFDEWHRTNPINRMLGTISTDQYSYIFFSSFFRDLSKPGEYRLLRAESSPAAQLQPIVGPVWVLGEGDATAISIVQGLLVMAGKKPDQIRLERAEKHMGEWGLSSVCIGAHNPKTRVILAKSPKCRYVFDLNYKVITLRDEEITNPEGSPFPLKRGVYITQTQDSEPTDYGLVARISDPFHPTSKTIIVIAGIGPAGTAGAAYYLARNFSDLARQEGDFNLLIQVPSGYQSARQVEFADVADFYAPSVEA